MLDFEQMGVFEIFEQMGVCEILEQKKGVCEILEQKDGSVRSFDLSSRRETANVFGTKL